MIKLEIIVQPKSEKYLELSQSLELMKSNLLKLCPSLSITKENKTFSIIAEFTSVKQLTSVLRSKEYRILSGAIRILGEKSEIIIHGIGHKNKGSDLKEVRLNYLKKKKTINN